MHRLGPALILLGIILLASPLYLGQSTIYLIDPNDVWNRPVTPGGTPQTPEVIVTSLTTILFEGSLTRATSNWELPGGCATYIIYARVYDGSTLVKTVIWLGDNNEIRQQTSGSDKICVFSKTVPRSDFQQDKLYVVKWSLEVRDNNLNTLGTINKPSDTAFIIKAVPTVEWYVNDKKATSINDVFLVTPPVKFKMVVVAGDPSMIDTVRVIIWKGTTELARITLSKTSTTTWEATWNTQERGQLTVQGQMVVAGTIYVGLSMLIDFGGGGGGGGGLSGLTPLQMIGAVTLLAGIASMVVRRER
jgi:hypothetical protein